MDIIKDNFNDLLKRFNKVKTSMHSKNTIEEGAAIFQDGISFLEAIKEYKTKLEDLLSDCQDFVKDAVDDLNQTNRKENFVFHTKNGMLSYNTRSLVIDGKMSILNHNIKKKPEEEKKPTLKLNIAYPIEKIEVKEMHVTYNVPVTNNLLEIPPMFYYFTGNSKYPAGLYTSPTQNMFVKVPFPIVIDSTKDYSKFRSIRCKYKTRVACDEQRTKMAKYHLSDVRQCNFAHTGEKIIKIGYPSRCSEIPSFGNPDTFQQNYPEIDKEQLKSIMLYGISDLISVALTVDNMKYNQNPTVLIDIS